MYKNRVWLIEPSSSFSHCIITAWLEGRVDVLLTWAAFLSHRSNSVSVSIQSGDRNQTHKLNGEDVILRIINK